ncbi:origin recognition complex subunit 2 [Pancytospora epiphaga]|nr:origin recognition complex subunit 2 [Pancytospora epiphaga]
MKNIKENTALLDFHISCSQEFDYILKEFNILFYGYGSKHALLELLFPDAIIFNLKLQNLSSVVEDLVLSGYHTKSKATIRDIDEWLGRNKKTLILILINFDFGLKDLQGLENIQIVGTMESIDMECTLKDIEDFNFLLRDLTTFVDYSDEVLDVEIRSDKVLSVQRVVSNVPQRVATLFRDLVELGSCTINELYNNVKKQMMLTRKDTIENLLREFIDHGIVKIKDNTNIVLNLNKEERKRFLENK